MTGIVDQLAGLAQRREAMVAGLLLAVVLLLWVGRKVRTIARSERPDDTLSNLVMLIGLGWSSEAVWEITRNRLGFPLGLTLLLFFVFESMLTLSMIRAKRHMREHGWPGRSGTTAWTIATCMALVALVASHSISEAVLRVAIPLLVVKQWWDGLVGGAAKRPADASTWRWTPRRILLALGAIEPGERDVHTVHRERLTQQMTRLYHRYNHGSAGLKSRRAARLARLSLTADDAIIAEVQRRGDRALWFHGTHPLPSTVPAAPDATRVPDAPSVPAPTPISTEPTAPPVPVDAPPPAVEPNPENPAPARPATQEPARPSEQTHSKAVPTPVVIAARATQPSSTSQDRSATSFPRKPSPRPRPSTAATTAPPLARPAADTSVTRPDPAQLKLPLVAPDLLDRAAEAARQHRDEHGEPIRPGQLAARLRVSTEQATDALALLQGREPIPAVNGRSPSKANR